MPQKIKIECDDCKGEEFETEGVLLIGKQKEGGFINSHQLDPVEAALNLVKHLTNDEYGLFLMQLIKIKQIKDGEFQWPLQTNEN